MQKPRSEDPCLLISPLCELCSTDPAREAEVISDERTRPRLPADRLLLDNERRKALRRRVDRGREAGRARADYDHFEIAHLAEDCPYSVRPRELGVRWIDEEPAIEHPHQGSVIALAGLGEQSSALRGVARQRAVGNAVAVEKTSELLSSLGA